MKGALTLRIRPDGTEETSVLLSIKKDEYRRLLFEFEDGEIWSFSQWITDIPLPDIHKVWRLDACGKDNVPEDPHIKRVPTEIVLWPNNHIPGRFLIHRPQDAITQTLEKAIRRSRTPMDNAWWKNLMNRYEEQDGTTKRRKWEQVAHIVCLSADGQRGKPVKDRRCDYLTPRKLANLMKRLPTGKNMSDFEREYGETLRRSVEREERKSATRP